MCVCVCACVCYAVVQLVKECIWRMENIRDLAELQIQVTVMASYDIISIGKRKHTIASLTQEYE